MIRSLAILSLSLLGSIAFAASTPVAASAVDLASDKNSWDFTIRTGISTGPITVTTTTAAGDTQASADTYGAIPLGLVLNEELNAATKLAIDLTIDADLDNKTASRIGLGVAYGVHILGGSKRNIEASKDVSIVYRDPMSLTVLGRAGFNQYSLNDLKNGSGASGGAVDVELGMEFRNDFGQSSSLTLTVMTTVLSLSTGSGGITDKINEFLVGYRFYL